MNWKAAMIIATTAFLITVLFSVSGYVTQKKQSQILKSKWQHSINEVNAQKSSLETDLANLEVDLGEQILENDSLQETLESRLVEISSLKNKIYAVQKKLNTSQANADAIRGRLAQLEELKQALETDVVMLTAENASLSQTNQQLSVDVMMSQTKVEELNDKVARLNKVNLGLANRLAEIAPAGFTAENFVIATKKKNQKLTTKASRTQSIEVEFDLNHVPRKYHNQHEIYLVLTDQFGEPVQQIETTDVMVQAGDVKWPVQAVDIEQVNVTGEQMIAMSIEPMDDLDPGQYNLVVYADNGLLGATGFQLR